MKIIKSNNPGSVWLLAICAALGCRATASSQSTHAILETESQHQSKPAVLQDDEQRLRTLQSVARIDDHPLYVMKFFGGYAADATIETGLIQPATRRWACSLFVAMGDQHHPVYGRNFDWQENPALVLFTDSPDGHASVSMVDVSYLGYERQDKKFESLEGRAALLRAPLIPFDGMNEHGLVVGMAAVDSAELPEHPEKPTVGSLRIIRLVLDQCKTIEEGIAVFEKYNLDFDGGPQIHYLLADLHGHSALIELDDRQMNVMRNDENWQAATNFCLHGNQDRASALCARYAQIKQRLSKSQGKLSSDQALGLLKDVAQQNTRWSVVYDMKDTATNIVMSRKFEHPIRLLLIDEKPVEAR